MEGIGCLGEIDVYLVRKGEGGGVVGGGWGRYVVVLRGWRGLDEGEYR